MYINIVNLSDCLYTFVRLLLVIYNKLFKYIISVFTFIKCVTAVHDLLTYRVPNYVFFIYIRFQSLMIDNI